MSGRPGAWPSQTRPAVALLGDETAYTGLARSAHHRWFTDPASRLVHPESDHAAQSRLMAADLHGAYTHHSEKSRGAKLVDALKQESPEFAALWHEHVFLGPHCASKRFLHSQVGALELRCQTLVDPEQSQRLVVYTAPGTKSHTNLQLLSLLPIAEGTASSVNPAPRGDHDSLHLDITPTTQRVGM
ncbi:hypothetical protein [Streptomyces sp. NPDC005476]|uniref:MmyB family transcriptional regulator n=1 Tax=Streptomyces sp. NPDC005476 TaxID=3156882 RepID=UPI003451C445